MDATKLAEVMKWMLDNRISCPSPSTGKNVAEHFIQIKRAMVNVKDEEIRSLLNSYITAGRFTCEMASRRRRRI